VGLGSELLSRWAPIVRALELRSASGGRFDIYLDDELVFSKQKSRRFPQPGEVARFFEQKLGPALDWRTT
jgi:selT/selW/selH-like putative selenoprotein